MVDWRDGGAFCLPGLTQENSLVSGAGNGSFMGVLCPFLPRKLVLGRRRHLSGPLPPTPYLTPLLHHTYTTTRVSDIGVILTEERVGIEEVTADNEDV